METQKIEIRKNRSPQAHINLLEWNPGNGKWYPINERKLFFCNGNPDEATQLFTHHKHGSASSELNNQIRKILNALNDRQTVTVEGYYQRTQRRIVIKLEEVNKNA